LFIFSDINFFLFSNTWIAFSILPTYTIGSYFLV
jgi:hypothetical protein